MIYITGPGHGGPGIVANTYLEGTYSEVYPHISQDEDGMKRLFKQFSFPGGIPSHVAPETPGSIHEGGELGYALSHAYGAAFDNPDLLVACVVGDGEAETGPLATSWHSNKFLNPVHDGAVLPILHLNGYKIAGPDGAGAHSPRRTGSALPRLRLRAVFRRGRRSDGDAPTHGRDSRHGDRRDPARSNARPARRGSQSRPRWPMIILRSPKGWTGPKVVDGKPTEGTFRSHQVPMGDMSRPGHVKILEKWMKSYRPAGVVRQDGPARSPSSRHWRQQGERRMSANPHANGGLLLRDLRLPDFRDYAVRCRSRAPSTPRPPAFRAQFIRDVINTEPGQLPRLQPGRNDLESLERGVRGDESVFDRGRSCQATTTSRRTAASWKC